MGLARANTPKTPKSATKRPRTPQSFAKKRKEEKDEAEKEVTLFSSEDEEKTNDDNNEVAKDKSFSPPSFERANTPKRRRSSGSSGNKSQLVDLSMYGEDELQKDRDEVASQISFDSQKSLNESKNSDLNKSKDITKEKNKNESKIEAEISQMSKEFDEFEDFELTIEYKKSEKKKQGDGQENSTDDEPFESSSRHRRENTASSSLDVNFTGSSTHRSSLATISTPKSAKTVSDFDSIYSPSEPLSAIENSSLSHTDWSDLSALDASKSNNRTSNVQTPQSSLKRPPLSSSTPFSAPRLSKQRRK